MNDNIIKDPGPKPDIKLSSIDRPDSVLYPNTDSELDVNLDDILHKRR